MRIMRTLRKFGKLVVETPLMLRGYCLNLFGVLFTRDSSWISEKTVNHERIHDAQMRELLWVPFYLVYVAEWLWLLVKYGDSRRAYLCISHEREAYAHGDDLSYLPRRRPFAQWR